MPSSDSATAVPYLKESLSGMLSPMVSHSPGEINSFQLVPWCSTFPIVLTVMVCTTFAIVQILHPGSHCHSSTPQSGPPAKTQSEPSRRSIPINQRQLNSKGEILRA